MINAPSFTQRKPDDVCSASADRWLQEPQLPPQVLALAWRERELATLVYEHGALRALDVQALLSEPLSNGAVRSMLGRLVTKNILKRRAGGSGKAFVYVPAITTQSAVRLAFTRLAEDYFQGSQQQALSAIRLLVQDGKDPQQQRA